MPQTFEEAKRFFADEEKAFEFFRELRWPQGPVCPRCGGTRHSFLSTRKIWKCASCRKQFSVKVGTIFEDSPIRLDKWLVAIWMVANSKSGISSYELHRGIGVTQKTAWFMLHRIRVATRTQSFARSAPFLAKQERTSQGLPRGEGIAEWVKRSICACWSAVIKAVRKVWRRLFGGRLTRKFGRSLRLLFYPGRSEPAAS